MSERFGEAAVDLCSTVSQLLGWRPEELWNCTPAELATALSFSGSRTDPPDRITIDALRKRFPDDKKA